MKISDVVPVFHHGDTPCGGRGAGRIHVVRAASRLPALVMIVVAAVLMVLVLLLTAAAVFAAVVVAGPFRSPCLGCAVSAIAAIGGRGRKVIFPADGRRHVVHLGEAGAGAERERQKERKHRLGVHECSPSMRAGVCSLR
jgi:hypothetical protein